jgi:hypothetical protein
MAIDHGCQMCPAILPHGTCITSIAQRSLLCRARLLLPRARGRGVQGSLMDQPALLFQHPIEGLVIHTARPSRNRNNAHSRRYPKVGCSWIRPDWLRGLPQRPGARSPLGAGAGHTPHPTTPGTPRHPPQWLSCVGRLPVQRVRFQGNAVPNQSLPYYMYPGISKATCLKSSGIYLSFSRCRSALLYQSSG